MSLESARVRSIRLVERLGEVWIGVDEVLGRRVADKAIHTERRPSPGARARFFREARLLSHLEHPNF